MTVSPITIPSWNTTPTFPTISHNVQTSSLLSTSSNRARSTTTWGRAMWVTRSTPGLGACVTMVSISHYFLLFSDHRTLVFQLVASMYSTCVLRSVHYSNAPPTSNLLTASELFSSHRYQVLVGSKLKARSGCSVTSCEANGWSCIECFFERCSFCVVIDSCSRFLLDILSSTCSFLVTFLKISLRQIVR